MDECAIVDYKLDSSVFTFSRHRAAINEAFILYYSRNEDIHVHAPGGFFPTQLCIWEDVDFIAVIILHGWRTGQRAV